MRETIELNPDALAVCASVFAGVSRGLFADDDYTAIWETLPEETREWVLGMVAANRMEMEDNS